jgi:cytochrome o ubiquinol oxidase subunit 2
MAAESRPARRGPQASARTFDKYLATARRMLCLAALSPLGGCSIELFAPKGDIAQQEKTLILVALGLMLLVVIPVIALTLYFGWRYRASNTNAVYAPKWAHSTRIEAVVWAIPCVIVAFLAVLIWRTTHSLDPYKPIASSTPPVRVEVVALNWKWLFIYPDYGVASVNRLAIPVGTPIAFKITAESMMNSFFIPQLGSQVYAMAGMQTQLHLIADSPGTYAGLSAAFSGPGFSDMHFDVAATTRQAFDSWVEQARKSPLALDAKTYRVLEQPSMKNPVTVYARVDPDLFIDVVNKYMPSPTSSPMPGDMPMHGMSMPHTEAAE